LPATSSDPALADRIATPICHITFPAASDVDYSLERSVDLVNWTHLTTVSTYTGTVTYFDETTEGLQFYRVRDMTPSPR